YDTYSFSLQPPSFLKFNNDFSGTYDEARINGNNPPTASNKPLNISISEFIDSGRAVYYGGGGSSSAGGGGGSTEEGYLLQQFTGWINNGDSYSPVLDDNSEYKINILNRNLVGYSYPYAPIWYSFDIDSSDGATSNLSYPGGSYIGTGYNAGTNTLTISASSTQVYQVNIYKKVNVGGAGASSNSGITNSVITSHSSFSGTLPNAVLVSGVGASSSSFYMASYVGTAPAYLMYAAGVSDSVTARIDFNHNASGTINNNDSCTTPYSSLQEMIDSGVAIYY
ncbi:MAG: hypothetical protein CL885_03680, partial [Dehalococcoidia bacterium]|nr:hypothetical protein [Dehalococcoidia bacterium]